MTNEKRAGGDYIHSKITIITLIFLVSTCGCLEHHDVEKKLEIMFEEHTKVVFNFSNSSFCQDGEDANCHLIEDYSLKITDLNVTNLFINFTSNIREPTWGGGECTIFINASSPNDTDVTFIPSNSIMEWKENTTTGNLSFNMGINALLEESPHSQSVAKDDVPQFLKEHEHENGLGDWGLTIDMNNRGHCFPAYALINWTMTVTEIYYESTIIDEK